MPFLSVVAHMPDKFGNGTNVSISGRDVLDCDPLSEWQSIYYRLIKLHEFLAPNANNCKQNNLYIMCTV